MLLVLSDKGKGMQSSSEQPLVGGGALRDDPNNGREGDYWTTVLFTLIKQFPSRSKLLIDMPK